MKLYYYLFAIIFISLNLPALEIISVEKTFDYSNPFTYKKELIKEARANKFAFGKEPSSDDQRAEIFTAKIKAKAMEAGKYFIHFIYKTQKSKEQKEMIQKVKLNKRTNKINFYFSAAKNKTEGRVELWKIKIRKNKKTIAQYKSHGNRWRS